MNSMAGYRGHIVGASLCNAAFVGALAFAPGNILRYTGGILSDWQLLAGLFVIAVLFGLWPDIDTNSMGQNVFFGIAFFIDVILIVAGRYEAAAYLGLLAMTPIIGKHRGWTHSKLAMLLIPLPIVLVPYWHNQQIWVTGLLIYGAAVSGYFSHLLLDGLIFRSFAIRHARRG